MPQKLVLLATDRYSINVNDFYMFFRRSGHEIVALLHHESCPGKCWWVENSFADRARDAVYDPMDFHRLRLHSWSSAEELPALLDRLDFDYVCMGNGTGADQRVVIDHVGRERCLFTEYGWLPWSANFYIARGGCGNRSDVAGMTATEIDSVPIDHAALRRARRQIRGGWPVLSRGFVYVPLQKDVNDFKFTLTDFRNNEEFLDFIHELVPLRMKVWVKRHPLYDKQYDLRKYGRFVDVSGRRMNKAHLYRNMRAMICINSTSVLEALLFRANVFAYGDDLFQRKGIVHDRVTDPAEFDARLSSPPNRERCDRFSSLLLSRQIDRHRCIANDTAYIARHYWTTNL